jgi:hypothetical protein
MSPAARARGRRRPSAREHSGGIPAHPPPYPLRWRGGVAKLVENSTQVLASKHRGRHRARFALAPALHGRSTTLGCGHDAQLVGLVLPPGKAAAGTSGEAKYNAWAIGCWIVAPVLPKGRN